MPHIPPVTKALLLICTAVFCLMQLIGPMLGGWLALWPIGSGNFMPWQPLTYAFLHSDMLALFFNMLGLWMFGAEIEQIWGSQRYARYLAVCTLTAALFQLLIAPLLGGFGPGLGASGALFGLLMAFGMMFPERTIMPLFPPIPMKARIFVMVFGGMALLFGLLGGQVSQIGDLGGMLGGWLMFRFWRGQPPFPPRRRR